jgi:drug/metabolite transporter (DMT)-like permease
MQSQSTAEPSILSPKILIPFILLTMIWGTTWIVIRDQLGVVPPSWSVCYRFLVGGIAMLIYAKVSGANLNIGRSGHMFAIPFGVAQFVLNFNFVYRAEIYITSGLVAVVFALLVVPNAIFGKIFLGQAVTRKFVIGSAIAFGGLALLFLNEVRADPSSQSATLIGVGLTLLGVLSASASNVMQATERAKLYPMASVLGWGMLWGAGINAVIATATTGAPVLDMRWAYFGGIAYLGIIASAIAFTLYFGVIRQIGPAKAAYSSVIIPIIAMLISTAVEGYVWTLLSVSGCALALAGLVVALSARKPST